MAWQVCAVPLPQGDSRVDCWVDDAGCLVEEPIDGAERLPGGYVLAGLVDAHAHPAAGEGPTGPIALDAAATLANLADWARAGVTALRDVGSPGGLTLALELPPGTPRVQAAGRFLAPQDQYFPSLLPAHAPEEQLTQLALGEISRGARWVKVIADFPRVDRGEPAGPSLATYSMDAIGDLVLAVHGAGARVAVHSTTENALDLVRAGVDSIEHGTGMDEQALGVMATSGAAWTPTLCAVLGAPDAALEPARRAQRAAFRERLNDLLPLALTLGVPVLTGSDAVGSVPREVMHLAANGLTPSEAIAAATTSAYRFLDIDIDRAGEPTSLVTYDDDPREDLEVLANPRAVLIDGVRVR
jgi:imidazolonepropionase-like amidohydrolase